MKKDFTTAGKAPLLVIFDQSERDLLAEVEYELEEKLNRKNLQNSLTRRAVELVYSDPKLRRRIIREILDNPVF